MIYCEGEWVNHVKIHLYSNYQSEGKKNLSWQLPADILFVLFFSETFGNYP